MPKPQYRLKVQIPANLVIGDLGFMGRGDLLIALRLDGGGDGWAALEQVRGPGVPNPYVRMQVGADGVV